MARTSLIFFIVISLSVSVVLRHASSLNVESTIVGTVLSVCQQATFYTPPGQPWVFSRAALTDELTAPSTAHRPQWTVDDQSKCLRDTKDVLAYCQKVYKSHSTAVTHVLPVQFPIPIDYFPSLSNEHANVAGTFWCLSSPTNSTLSSAGESYMEKDSHAPHRGHKKHLPSLLDVHKAYFANRFRALLNTTRTNVSHVIHSLVNETKGIRSLVRDNPQLAQYLISKLLHEAHQRLEQVWSKEESEWANVEEAQHVDFVKQLDEDDWTSEKEFTYALQEAGANIDRVQDAVTRLLTSLSASVQEEIRHLNAVRNEQPWTLRLDYVRNWTVAVSSHVTSVERVHQVLLVYVRQATDAINTLRGLMAEEIRKTATSNAANLASYATSVKQPYKPNLVRSYDRLQESLLEAQRLLNAVKQTLLSNLNHRSRVLLTDLNDTLHNTSLSSADLSEDRNTTADAAIEWIRTKHHAELAYIDLLIGQLLSPYYQYIPADLPNEQTVSSDLWHPQEAAFLIDSSSVPSTWDRTAPSMWWSGRPINEFIFTFILVFMILLGLLLFSCGVGLFVCLVRARLARLADPTSVHAPTSLRALVTDGVLKVKHWIGPTVRTRNARPRFRSQRTTAHSTISNAVLNPTCLSEQQQQQLHGYHNPMYPSGASCA